MGMVTLGLDLGIASIGWALVEEKHNVHELIHWGSRIFVPGMDDDIASGKGVSRCSIRRQKRALRRQYLRRRERKQRLIEALLAGGLLKSVPDAAFFTDIDQRLLRLFSPSEYRRKAHLIPYFYRKLALDQPLQPEELARAIFHLAQRRGYLSNRKQEARDEKNSGVVKKGINQLREEIRASGARTLGEYFCSVDPEEERVRCRYTERGMFLDEFRQICRAQRQLISEELERELFRAIFYQRPLKSCRHLIGRCRIYPDLPRCSFAGEEAQRFRILTTVRNLRVDSSGEIRSLTRDESQAVVALLDSFSPLFKKNGKITLGRLQKAAGLAPGEKFTLADEEKEIYGNELKNILFRAFGEGAAELSPEEKKKFFNDLASIRKEEVLRKRLRDYWKLPEDRVEDVAGISMPDGYCSFSRKALRELLPELEAGIDLSTVLKCRYPTEVDEVMDLLPLVDESGIELRNPVVHRVLTELRRTVNALIARYGKPDRIRIELSRDLKATNRERELATRRNREREKSRAEIASRIAVEAGIQNPSRNDILKVLLAEECNFECPYSGKHFEMRDLFSGALEIEHIIPYSRSFDDSFSNKTLCVKEYNARKNNRTPYEAFGGSPEYEAMLERVSHFKGGYAERKLELFEMTEVHSEEFLSRNLNDTRYASRLAMQYLGKLYGGIVDRTGKQRIFATTGSCTALVRRIWGGNFLLGEGEKVRGDHRHHAIDALTIALTTPGMVKWAAGLTPEQRKRMLESREFVDNDLYRQASSKLDQVAVSHHQVNKLRGELHQATFYSRDFGSGSSERHVRTALDSLTAKEVGNIVDKAVLKAVLDKLGVADPSEVTDRMLKRFQDPANLPVMCDRTGRAVNTIRKVRVRRVLKTRTIGKGEGRREVTNGENYLLAVFARVDEQGNELSWEGEVVSLLDAVQRHQRGLPLFERERPGMKFKFSLRKGDIVSWRRDGREQLCIIRGVSLPQFTCVPVNDARMQKDLKAAKVWYVPTMSAAFAGGMKKFRMNIFGELQRAND